MHPAPTSSPWEPTTHSTGSWTAPRWPAPTAFSWTTWKARRIECGDLICAVEDGAFQWGEAVEFGRVVAGRAPGRTSPDEITLFESQGIALWDIALGQVVLERAVAAGVGTCIGD